MAKRKSDNKKNTIIAIIAGIGTVWGLVVLVLGLYFGSYYRANSDALNALSGSKNVSVVTHDRRIVFDGPGEDALFVFYPGARVDYRAYSKIMLKLAEAGLDCVVVKMPLNYAIFDSGVFAEVREDFGNYERYYIGGHSMGGAMAAKYASKNADGLDGLVLLAAYSDKLLSENLRVLSIYGSNDKVLSRKITEKKASNLPLNTVVHEITGGNHAQFGDYGEQSFDGTADISAERQQSLTVQYILSFVKE